MFLLYLLYEAIVRFMGAYISDQVIGSLPLYAISGIHRLFGYSYVVQCESLLNHMGRCALRGR